MKKLNFNHGWRFTQEGTNRKETVTLPHDAMLHTPRNPEIRNYFLLAGFEGGRYIYTKTFTPEEEYRNKTLLLEFEAVYCMSSVYVNGKLAAEKPYGFTPFTVYLNDYLNYGNTNTIQVVADVPKEGHNRWYTGGGIYRPVNLYVGSENHIRHYGVKITTLAICPAIVRVETSIQGSGQLEVILRKDGLEVARQLRADAPEYTVMDFTLADAKLWSAETPELYEAEVILSGDGQEYDRVTECFGIRTIQTDPKQGLLINDVPVFLRGGCIHNDNGVIGVINNDATELHRAKNLKRAGFNAIRSAHHPMSRSLMKACDQVGLYVMDEAFDYWYRPKCANPHCAHFLDTFQEDARLMAEDAYNHPCVILYSIGNEIPEAGGQKGVRIGKQILAAIHSVDRTRLTTLCPSVHWLREYLEDMPYLTEDEDTWMAKSPANKEKDWKHYMRIFLGAAANLPDEEKGMTYPPTFVRQDEEATMNLYPCLDVAGYNYYEDRYETLHKLHPERLLLGTETRAERIPDTMRYARTHPFLIGDFVWTLQDHLGEVNCCSLYYGEDKDSAKAYPWLINYGGVLDITGRPQPSVHLFEFSWDEHKHGLYLASQPPIHGGEAPRHGSYRWSDAVEGWTYEGYEGQPTWVDVYTNAAEVEILINENPAGRTKIQNYFGKIPCTYQPGILTGVGYDEDGRELYRTTVRTAGKQTRITVKPDKTTLRAGCEDFAFLDIEITDNEGNLKLLPERDVHILVEGCASLQGFGSANPVNAARFDCATQRTYLGRLQAVLRSGIKTGSVTVTLSSPGLEDTNFVLRVQ